MHYSWFREPQLPSLPQPISLFECHACGMHGIQLALDLLPSDVGSLQLVMASKLMTDDFSLRTANSGLRTLSTRASACSQEYVSFDMSAKRRAQSREASYLMLSRLTTTF